MPALLNVIQQICDQPKLFGVPTAVSDQVQRRMSSTALAKSPAADAEQSEVSEAEGAISKIRTLQGKIQEVEVQAAIRQVQVKILEIKIRQVELMVLVRQAQQVVELKGKEASLIQKKRHLEQRIVDLDAKLKSLDGQSQVDPTTVLNLLSDLQSLLGQTESALASMGDSEDAGTGGSSRDASSGENCTLE